MLLRARRLGHQHYHRSPALRANDGSAPPAFYLPTSTDPGVWQPTPSCPAAGGVNFQWQFITPFGVPSTPGSQAWMAPFAPPPPPAITSSQYAKDYEEVHRVGSLSSTARPPDRTIVARFYQSSSPSLVFSLAARQVSVAQGRSLSHNARTLAARRTSRPSGAQGLLRAGHRIVAGW